jgi:uncharacterized protein YjbI with pentapeptide repeats
LNLHESYLASTSSYGDGERIPRANGRLRQSRPEYNPRPMVLERERALQLLRAGPEGVREWNALRNTPCELPELTGAHLGGRDLRSANLSGLDLRGADLEGADLQGANLELTKLEGANLTRANLADAVVMADLSRARLTEATLTKANLSYAVLHQAHIDHTNLNGAVLEKAQLEDADLSGATLDGAKLTEAVLARANLTNATIRWADLTRANLANARLEDAVLNESDLTEADLGGANLVGAYLFATCLARTTLRKAILKGAQLDGAELQGADLSSAQLQEVSLRGARIGGANLERADLSDANLSAAQLVAAHLRFALLVRADLRDANLTSTDFFGADLEGADLYRSCLDEASFVHARLEGTNLSSISAQRTSFGHALLLQTRILASDIGDAHGLETCSHTGPSHLDLQTLRRCGWRLPPTFLRGCGLADWEIEAAKLHDAALTPNERSEITYEMIRLQVGQPIQVNPLFISYSHEDGSFVDHMCSALDTAGIRYWRDTKDGTSGRIDKVLERAMTLNPTVLLVLSQASVRSDWVAFEIDAATKLARKLNRDVLCPVTLDTSWRSAENLSGQHRVQLEKYMVLDFGNWQESRNFKARFAKLIEGLGLHYPSGAT